MSEKIQVSGETIEEAIRAGLDQLGVERTDVAIEVVDEGSRGVLGIGQRDAVVVLRPLNDTEDEQPVEEDQPVVETVAAPASASDDLLVEPELEQEAEMALDIVTTIVDMMGIDATVRADISDADDLGERIVNVVIEGPESKMLIGEDGQTLNALQFITRSMASQQLQDRTRFAIDIDNFRKRRTDELVELAKDTAEKVTQFNRPISLDPMPPHERRIIHMTLRESAEVKTESKGDGDRRRVRVMPEGWVDRHVRDDRRGGYRGRQGGNRGRRGYGGGGRRYN